VVRQIHSPEPRAARRAPDARGQIAKKSSGWCSLRRSWFRSWRGAARLASLQAGLAASDAESLALRRDFIRTYLERDIPQFGPRIPAATLERLWALLAHHQGGLLNASSIARALELSAQTVTRYIDLLVDLLLVRRLPPVGANVAKRLVRSPKVYVRDSGLVHALLGIGSLSQLSGHPVQGASWEGMVIESLLAAAPWGTRAGFYRTAAGAEIDLVLEFPGGQRWAVEIKRSQAARPARGFHSALVDLRPEAAFVVHAGEARYPLADGIEALGIRALAARLRGGPNQR